MTAPADTLREALTVKAQAFVDRKYVARADERQKSMGLAYVEAERQDLAREIANFALAALALPEGAGTVRSALVLAREWMEALTKGYTKKYGQVEYEAALATVDAALSAPAEPAGREELADLIASKLECEKDCQSAPRGCGCALDAADAILALGATVTPQHRSPTGE